MGTQKWTYGLILYFLFISMTITFLSNAGVLSNREVITPDLALLEENFGSRINRTPNLFNIALTGNNVLADLYSFFVWNITITELPTAIMQSLWAIRLIFVWLPLLALMINIYFMMPTVTG